MAQREQEKSLAASANRISGDDEEAIAVESKKRSRRRFIKCCGCITATLLILVVIILVLVFTVFHVKDPVIRMNSVSIEGLNAALANGNLLPTVNLTLMADVSVKNPNAASFKYGNTTTTIFYGGSVIGEAHTPPGEAKARRTLHLNVSVDLLAQQVLAANPSLARDVISGSLTVNSFTAISGRVKILNIIKKHVDVRMNCSITVDANSRTIGNPDCQRHVSL